MSSSDPAATSLRPYARFRAVGVSALLLALAGIASGVSSNFIAREFPDRPTPRDLLFETLPHWHVAQYTADLALLGALVILVVCTVNRGSRQVAEAICVFALMYLLRAFAMALTPLASAHGNGALFGVVPAVQNGMWPSGHAGAALLCVLLLVTDSVALRRLTLTLAVLVWLSLVIGHAHYSIDILGGMLLAYFVQREWANGSAFRPIRALLGPVAPAQTR